MGKKYIINNGKKELEIEIVFVQGGSFMMGSENGIEEASPIHKVVLSDFQIGKYLVTQELYEFVMGENPSRFKGKKLPVEMIRWVDAKNFMTEINKMIDNVVFRLPTEAEWEYAARGGIHWQDGFFYSGSNDLNEVGWFFNLDPKFVKEAKENLRTREVGLKKPNQLGIYDMSGNVYEWTQDEWDYMYNIVKKKGYKNDGRAYVYRDKQDDFEEHTRRGGSFRSMVSNENNKSWPLCGVTNRNTGGFFEGSDFAGESLDVNGFRLAI